MTFKSYFKTLVTYTYFP